MVLSKGPKYKHFNGVGRLHLIWPVNWRDRIQIIVIGIWYRVGSVHRGSVWSDSKVVV